MSGILMSGAHLPTLGLIDFNSFDEYCSALRQSSLMFVAIHQLAAGNRNINPLHYQCQLAQATKEKRITGAMICLLPDRGPHHQAVAVSRRTSRCRFF